MRTISLAASGLASSIVLLSCSSSTNGSASSVIPSATSSSSPSPTPESLPARTADYDVAKVNPCSLLTSSQKMGLGITLPPTGPTPDPDSEGSASCSFVDSVNTVGFGVNTDTVHPAKYFLNSTALAGVQTIDGVSAVVIDGGRSGCTYALDVASAASIQVGSTSPGSTAAIDCPKAKKLADDVIQTLKSLQPS